jgi:hypothetical protein
VAGPKEITPVQVAALAGAPSTFSAASLYTSDCSDTISVKGICTLGTANLHLMQWCSTALAWFPVDGDARGGPEIQVDATKPTGIPGRFRSTFGAGRVGQVLCVVKEGAGTIPTLWIEQGEI